MPVLLSTSSIKRRQFLSGLMKLLVFIGFIFMSIPFISSFSSNDIEKKQTISSPWVISVPVSELAAGKVKALNWSGGITWVYKRTENDIQSLNKHNDALRDALSKHSEQPEKMNNNLRSASENIFVFIPQENKRGCQVTLYDDHETGRNAVFSEPCYRAKYDAAGRILKNTGHKEQHNLSVPNHVIEDGILKIGIWKAKLK